MYSISQEMHSFLTESKLFFSQRVRYFFTEGTFYFSQIYTEEQISQSFTETLSQPSSQNLTANVS
ncbi:hypothetical protein HMPREF0666_00211 [Prevotella sp. C561]|nr:hypothetical protein HMPREF0666_00211 [Prevotella sp. C561]